jgi:hypothetical protein
MPGSPSALSEELREAIEQEYRTLIRRLDEQRERAEHLRALAEHVAEQASQDEHLLRELEAVLGIDPQLRIESLDQRLRGQRLQEIAVEVLSREVGPGKAVHYKEWYALLRKTGHAVAGKDPVANFLAQINRSPAIEPVGRRSGMYLLRAAA